MRPSHLKISSRAWKGAGGMAMLPVAAWGLIGAAGVSADDSPDPLFEKPEPVTMAELARRATPGVTALEVNDYRLVTTRAHLPRVRRTPT